MAETAREKVATLNQQPIFLEEWVESLAATIPAEEVPQVLSDPPRRAAALRSFLDMKALVAKAQRDKLDQALPFQKAVGMLEIRELTHVMTERDRAVLTRIPEISDQELKEIYERSPAPDPTVPRPPYEKIKASLRQQAEAKALDDTHSRYRQALMDEFSFKKTAAGSANPTPEELEVLPAETLLATLGDEPIRQEDFQWFFMDAFRPEQRRQALSQAGAILNYRESYFIMRLMAAKARKLGLDQTPEYLVRLHWRKQGLLSEFMQEKDNAVIWKQLGNSAEEREAAHRKYLDHVWTEVNLKAEP